MAKTKQKLLSLSEYARSRGLAPSTITRQVRNGTIPTREGRIDPKEADQARKEMLHRARPAAVATMRSTAELETFAAAQARKESALADMRGTLIDAEQAKRAWGGLVAATRSCLLLMPGRLAPYLAVSSDAVECQVILDKAIREALTNLSHWTPESEA